MSDADALRSAERWFLEHGPPYFVDDVRADVRRRLSRPRLLLPLATRALPMLLLFVTFLFINTEVWQSGQHRVSQELARVSIFLAAFSGLQFTVYAVTDTNYRQQFFAKIMRELARVVGACVSATASRGVRRDSP